MVRAELDSQIATAKQYPRSIGQSLKNAIAFATMTQNVAASCTYAMPRGGKMVTGPSVRLAEIVASCWGNMRFGARVVDDDGKMLTVQGFAHDLETNTGFSFDLKVRVTDKYGKRYSDDMVVMAANAGSAKALRNAVFKVVPRVLVDEILAETQRVAAGDAKTFAKRRSDAFAHFKKLGVEEKKLLTLCGKDTVEDIEGADIAMLLGVAQAIKEGEMTVEEAFPVAAVANGPDPLAAQFGKASPPPKAKSAPTVIVNPPPQIADDAGPTGENWDNDPPPTSGLFGSNAATEKSQLDATK